MGFKKSNPGKTMLILLSIVVVMLLLVQLLTLVTAISLYRVASQDEPDSYDEAESSWDAAEDAAIAMCGICFFWPVVLLYTGVAFGLTLIGRDVYGKMHSISTIIGMLVGMFGVVFALFGTFMSMIIFGPEVGIPVSITIPVVLVSVGLFLYIKDVGGMIWGAIGMGITSISQMALCGVLIIIFDKQYIYDSDILIIMGILLILGTILGLVLLGIGFIFSYIWMSKNPPLLDEQQAQQLQMQQHQVNLQQQQLSLQQQQLSLQQQTYDTVSGGQQQGYIPPSRQSANQDDEWEWEDDR